MGFFDEKVDNGFDALFDMNRDGVLDTWEQGLRYEYLDRAQHKEMAGDYDNSDTDSEDYDDSDTDPEDYDDLDVDSEDDY